MNNVTYYIWLSHQLRGFDISELQAENIFRQASQRGIGMVSIESEDYPDCLRVLDSPPLLLYFIGNLNLLADRSVHKIALVGTRRASPYGRWAANEIGRNISRCGAVHVSGMAEGIDAIGHRAVISSGGKSIAVLGTGIDFCYPKSSMDIYDRIRQNGLIISEYPPGESGRPSNFPQRNRIISGLSSKVVIVEGALRSGSMITARLALEQGKDIYAVPGNINQPGSAGPNTLIEDGAIPIVNPNEIEMILGI